MLDDIKYIHRKDADDALGVAAKQWDQLNYDFDLSSLPKTFSPISNVVYAGMGGSALGASLSSAWPGYNRPFEIIRGYDLPSYVGPETLVICSSYSGNTEETLSCLQQAIKSKSTVMVIAGGGKLVELAKDNKLPLVVLPKISQPRYAVLANFLATVRVIEQAKLSDTKQMDKTIVATAKYLKQLQTDWLPLVPVARNKAKKLALDLLGTSPVIYSGPRLASAGYKWKISFNENAKNVAWQGVYPEFSHNEFIGWSSHPISKPYSIIDLVSDFDHPQINKRIKISAKLLSGNRPHPYTVHIKAKNVLEELLGSVLYGDFVTIYLALLNGVNPTPVELVEKMKKELK
ncbi:bifunctional phosphoglucose/phosphomannose isomerase [Candidatus Saccharibacteria bacterium]|nr:bifunctional phosphoglucose/phosphomannose isomerase [Candidatus Saccharibacteria bacterium]